MRPFTVLTLLLSSACASTAEPVSPLSWMTGCWEKEDGSIKEVWSAREGGHMFGYSVYLEEDQSTFFEQMRIDFEDGPVFSAYPLGNGPSPFPSVELSDTSVTFQNAEHDYPQRIQYTLSGTGLDAVISLADGSRPGTFTFKPCAHSSG